MAEKENREALPPPTISAESLEPDEHRHNTGIIMTNLKIEFKAKGSEETTVTIPLQALHVAVKYLPKALEAHLNKLGIDIGQSTELGKDKALRGVFIDIETPNSKLKISAE